MVGVSGGKTKRESTLMYGVRDTAATVVPTVAGAATLPATGGSTLLTALVASIVAIGALATIVQIGTIIYRRRALNQ